MKRFFSSILTAFIILGLVACHSADQRKNGEGFSPKLDRSTACKISVVGTYSNFEALEAEFDCFNEYYPDVELSYTKIDDYNNLISTVLD